jgi:hypothetical protein
MNMDGTSLLLFGVSLVDSLAFESVRAAVQVQFLKIYPVGKYSSVSLLHSVMIRFVYSIKQL